MWLCPLCLFKLLSTQWTSLTSCFKSRLNSLSKLTDFPVFCFEGLSAPSQSRHICLGINNCSGCWSRVVTHQWCHVASYPCGQPSGHSSGALREILHSTQGGISYEMKRRYNCLFFKNVMARRWGKGKGDAGSAIGGGKKESWSRSPEKT